MKCSLCEIETNNPKYCSQTCAIRVNNRIKPKRKLTKECAKCGKLIRKSFKFCSFCYDDIRKSFLLLTKQQTLTNDTQRYRKIRIHARTTARKAGLLSTCAVCPYSFHVETCHLKPIESYSMDATIAEINHVSNLIGLCPNHHWELDHGIDIWQQKLAVGGLDQVTWSNQPTLDPHGFWQAVFGDESRRVAENIDLTKS